MLIGYPVISHEYSSSSLKYEELQTNIVTFVSKRNYDSLVRYWWVNQNQTYRFEVGAGFLWSPKKRSDGGRHYFYDSMTEVTPGDIVFSYAESMIKAVGVVQCPATTSPKPDFAGAGENWSQEGWYVEVEYLELASPFRPKDYINVIAPLLNEKYAPIQKSGNGLQGVYLTELSSELGQVLLGIANITPKWLLDMYGATYEPNSEYELNIELQARQLQGSPEKIQIIKSRRGQGVFKANVRLIERQCRVTGVTNIRHLRASHIKPWSLSNDEEKIDGNNGLLLSPHIDHLFDSGFISFLKDGKIEVSKELNPDVLERWSISSNRNVGNFTQRQQQFLEFHRSEIFQK